jgi:hypothetical protein
MLVFVSKLKATVRIKFVYALHLSSFFVRTSGGQVGELRCLFALAVPNMILISDCSLCLLGFCVLRYLLCTVCTGLDIGTL